MSGRLTTVQLAAQHDVSKSHLKQVLKSLESQGVVTKKMHRNDKPTWCWHLVEPKASETASSSS
ncbi:hypothetical protein BZG36_02239 [Bifiguratus adelaidae]|uniref:HTH marR-type domain-containing protein n=1 Tax=Bifiguratus adelaidae TaxID=1938954 RepID=A0A261Y1K6_9FUNG|nr:hypothetical protein BZG36_02239 [Bifiguratus adelaidae]